MGKYQERVKQILRDKGLYKIPIDIVAVAKSEGFSVLQQNLDNCSGLILVNMENPFVIDKNSYEKAIVIDNNQTAARKNFTIAHELGHYFLEFSPEKGKIFAHRENGPAYSARENDANSFASELLMPHELLDNFIKEIKKYYNNYYILANAISDAFNVSVPAAQYRLDNYLRGI